jgi:tellurite resistance-related uncharacterized protein
MERINKFNLARPEMVELLIRTHVPKGGTWDNLTITDGQIIFDTYDQRGRKGFASLTAGQTQILERIKAL